MRYLILPLVLLLVSCSSTLPSIKTYKMDVQQGNVITPKMMLQLKPAMTKSQVRFILGTPLLADTFHRDRWDYFYEMNRGGKVIERRRVILEFENESLKSVRGDIIPAGQPGAENAPVASVREIRSARSNKELMLEDSNKPWWERFKFWGEEQEEAAHQEQKVDARAAPAVAASQSVKSGTTQSANAPAVPASANTPSVAPEKAVAVEKPVKAEKISAPPPVDTEAGQVAAQLQRWNSAWQGRKLNDYLNLYSANFVPEGVSRRAWLEQQQQKFGSAEYVEDIKIENVQVEVHGSIASVQFDQISTTPAGIKKISKEFGFENEGGLWRIVRESVKTAFAPESLPAQPATANQEGVILHERSEAPPEYPAEPVKPSSVKPETVKPTQTAKKTQLSQLHRNRRMIKINCLSLRKKDLPLPAEDAPGYFEKLLEKIGF